MFAKLLIKFNKFNENIIPDIIEHLLNISYIIFYCLIKLITIFRKELELKLLYILKNNIYYKITLRRRLPDGNLLFYRVLCDKAKVESIYKEKVYNYFKIDKEDIVFDVGAHIGVYSLKLSKKAKLIVAFEPHPENFKLLRKNVMINKLKNIVLYDYALSYFNGKAKLYLSHLPGSHSMVLRRSHEYIYVKVKTIEEVMNELSIDHIDLLKINAEGAELDILKGSQLNKIKKLIIAANHTENQAKEIIKYLSSMGNFYIKYNHNSGRIYAKNLDSQFKK